MIEIMSSRDFIGQLLQYADSELTLAAGRMLFATGEPVRAAFVVRAGAVSLVRHQAGGAALVLQRAGAGVLLAEASLFAGRYHCDAIAAQPSRLARVPRRAVAALQQENPQWLASLAAHLAGEVQRARGRAELLSLRTVTQRLDAWRALTGQPLPPRGEWLALAQEIGVSPEALYRELARRRSGR